MTTDVDAYVNANLEPHQQKIFGVLQELVHRHAPHAQAVISRGSPAWKATGLLAIISRSKTHLTLAFARGAEFTDAHGLLEGVGKTTRHIKIKSADAVDADAIADYLRQAVALDRR